MTQHESQSTTSASSWRATLLAVVAALVLVGAFVWRNAQRLPYDGPLSYDEATHLEEGAEIADLLAKGDPAILVEHFLKTKIMKGVLYRLWYGVGFTRIEPGIDHGRAIGLVAGGLALLLVFLLARAVAPRDLKNRTAVLALLCAVGAPILHDQLRRAMVEPINLLTLCIALCGFVLDRRKETIGTAIFAALALLVAVATKYNHALVLLVAIGLDSTIEAWSRRALPIRARLRPFLPIAITLLPVLLYLSSPTRLKSVWYYIWTIPDGGNPVNLSGSLYLETMISRIAPSSLGCVLVLCCAVLGAVVVFRERLPGGRLLVLHLLIGLGLAQSNDLKLERILVPLLGSFFALVGVGAAFATKTIRFSKPALHPISLALALLLWIGVPSRALYALEKNPYRETNAWLDAGIAYSKQNPRALWIGGSFGEGMIWNSATVRLRARELGVNLPPDSFMFGGVEFFQKSRLDLSAVKSGGADAALARLLKSFRSLIVVLDPTMTEPTILNPLLRNVYARIKAGGEFELRGEPRVLAFPTAAGRPLRTRLEFWVRKPATR